MTPGELLPKNRSGKQVKRRRKLIQQAPKVMLTEKFYDIIMMNVEGPCTDKGNLTKHKKMRYW